MVKYVDAGYEDPSSAGNKKKKSKKGFKVDRRANYERMMARKFTGKEAKQPAEKRPTRVKSIVFDDTARRDYLLTLHKKKNERRVQAFVDIKKKMRKDNARTRQQQREEARRAYNNYARVPILPNYTFQMPSYVDKLVGSDDDAEDEEDNEDVSEHGSVVDDHNSDAGLPVNSEDEQQGEEDPWVYMGDEGEVEEGEEGEEEEEEEEEDDEEGEEEEEERLRAILKEKQRLRKQATKSKSVHAMPAAMTNGGRAADDEAVARAHHHHPSIDEDTVTVEVKPLFSGRGAMTANASATVGKGGKKIAVSTLPSQNFSDLPAVVEQELRRLRQDTKGPSRTKSKVHMMKELEKIRKIKKHSRKGHGKRKTSGKRKNRRK